VSAICDSLVNSALRYLAYHFGFLPVPAEMADKYLAKAREVVPVFDRRLGESRYLAGDAVTAADLFLAPLVFNFPAVPGLKELGEAAPDLTCWMAEMSERPSMTATRPDPIAARAA
jgi:glutathione S-transferase